MFCLVYHFCYALNGRCVFVNLGGLNGKGGSHQPQGDGLKRTLEHRLKFSKEFKDYLDDIAINWLLNLVAS